MEQTLDFKVIFYLIRKNILWILLAAVIGATASFLFSKYMIDENFTSSAEIYISNSQGLQGEIDAGDLSAARSMASTYRIILQSDKAKALLREALAKNQTYKDSPYKSSYKYSVSVREESEVLRINVMSRDPYLSAEVCNEMVNVAEILIGEIFSDSGRAHSLGSAKPNTIPASPDVSSNMVMGAIVGFVLASVMFVLWALLDNRVKDEADFVSKVKIPVLGEVPSIHENTDLKEGYYYAYSKKQDD
ncbi:MAG: hypothetical protein E7598_04585 [Ruminococcaceae bacterium]|nr:hypothetical protein [Oscillospiraceae bacterium]